MRVRKPKAKPASGWTQLTDKVGKAGKPRAAADSDVRTSSGFVQPRSFGGASLVEKALAANDKLRGLLD